MTVEQLIRELRKYPGTADVRIVVEGIKPLDIAEVEYDPTADEALLRAEE